MATIFITGTNKGVGLELVKIYAARGDTAPAQWRVPSRQDVNALVAR